MVAMARQKYAEEEYNTEVAVPTPRMSDLDPVLEGGEKSERESKVDNTIPEACAGDEPYNKIADEWKCEQGLEWVLESAETSDPVPEANALDTVVSEEEKSEQEPKGDNPIPETNERVQETTKEERCKQKVRPSPPPVSSVPAVSSLPYDW